LQSVTNDITMVKNKFKIGEFSKLCFVTVKTLRHYEKMGILSPQEVDPWTGYRYYGASQMDELHHILELKRMGFSLEEIRDLKEDGINMPTQVMIEKALAKAHDSMEILQSRIEALYQLQAFATNKIKMSNITIKPLPGGTVATFRKVLNSYAELGPFLCNSYYPEAVRLECVCPEETAYCFTIDHNKNYNPEHIDLEYCEVVTGHNDLSSDIITFKQIPVVERAVCYTHRGGYDTFDKSMAEIMEYMETHQLTIADNPRFCYIHGVWDRESVADWETIIQIPVR